MCKSLIETNSKAMIEEREQFNHMIAKERKQSEFQLAQEREVNRKLIADNQDFQSDLSKLRSENTMLQVTISELQADVVEKGGVLEMKGAAIKRKDAELEAKSRALEEKDAIISAMSEQVTKTREYLATKQQVSIHKIDQVVFKLLPQLKLHHEEGHNIFKLNCSTCIATSPKGFFRESNCHPGVFP